VLIQNQKKNQLTWLPQQINIYLYYKFKKIKVMENNNEFNIPAPVDVVGIIQGDVEIMFLIFLN